MLRPLRAALPVLLVTCIGLAGAPPLAPASAAPRVDGSAAVVVRWNQIAERTITAGNPAIPSSALYYGHVGLAVHDAVVAVAGRYEPSRPHSGPHARGVASTDVAAATAAHDVLAHFFPAAATDLAAELATTLEQAPDGAARRLGQRIGQAAAARTIASRAGDGVGASVPSPVGDAVGEWQFGVPQPVPMLVPWLGQVRPLLSSGRHAPPGPDPLTSAAYARDLAEVAAHGTATDPTDVGGTRAQTALFHNHNAVQQHQAAMRTEVTTRGLDVVDAARAFALLGASTADALIACWQAKREENYWRPSTAIQLAHLDGNPATTAQPDWTPRVGNPPYPEYPSGHACITGAASETYSALFGADRISVELFSSVTGTTRHYRTAGQLDADAMNGRLWLGLHFRKAMADGNALGHAVAADVIGSHLQQVEHGPGRR